MNHDEVSEVSGLPDKAFYHEATSSQVPIPELSLPEGGAAVQEDANYIYADKVLK